MEKFGKVIVKLRIPILVLSILLLIPSAIGYVNTRVLSYRQVWLSLMKTVKHLMEVLPR